MNQEVKQIPHILHTTICSTNDKERSTASVPDAHRPRGWRDFLQLQTPPLPPFDLSEPRRLLSILGGRPFPAYLRPFQRPEKKRQAQEPATVNKGNAYLHQSCRQVGVEVLEDGGGYFPDDRLHLRQLVLQRLDGVLQLLNVLAPGVRHLRDLHGEKEKLTAEHCGCSLRIVD